MAWERRRESRPQVKEGTGSVGFADICINISKECVNPVVAATLEWHRC